jgi:hypothetical protein
MEDTITVVVHDVAYTVSEKQVQKLVYEALNAARYDQELEDEARVNDPGGDPDAAFDIQYEMDPQFEAFEELVRLGYDICETSGVRAAQPPEGLKV